MPVDPGAGTHTPPSKPLVTPKTGPLPVPTAPGLTAALAPSPKPKLAEPLEHPHPVLAAAGVRGGVVAFNQRVQQISDAHEHAYGQLPSPGLVLDVARSSVEPNDYATLFSVPKSPIVARAVGSLSKTPSPDSVSVLASRLTDAVKAGALPQFIQRHADEVRQVYEDPSSRTDLAKAMWAAGVNDPAQVLQQSLFPEKMSVLGRIINAPMGPSEQIFFGIGLGIPTLAYEEGKGVYESVKQKSAMPFLRTNENLAKATYEGVKRDVTHPRDNIGNLILDLWGATSLVGGVAARGSAVGKALAEGVGAKAVTRAALTRAPTGTKELGQDAHVPLSTNPVAAKIQSFILDQRMKGLTVGDDQPVPAGATAVTLGERARQIASDLTDPSGLRTRYGSIENTIQRELRAADRVEQAMRLALIDPVLQVNKSAVATNGVVSRIGPRRWLGLSPAEQKAIQVAATDSLDPVSDWRTFHEKAIENKWGSPTAHKAHLDLLGPAEKALAAPSPKLQHAINAARDLMTEQTALRVRALGLSPEAADVRVARVGKTLRGEEGLASFFAGTHPELLAIEKQFPPAFRRQNGKSVRFDTPEAKAAKETLHRRLVAEERAGTAEAPTPSQFEGLKPGDKFTYRGPNGTGEGYLDAEGHPRNEKGEELFGIGNPYPTEGLKSELLAAEASGKYERIPANELLTEAVGYFLKEAKSGPKKKGLGERQTPESFYLPFVSPGNTRKPGGFWGARSNKYGIPVPSSMPELNHEFTGDSIRAGDFRVDATNLARESYVRTVHTVTRLNQWRRLFDHYSDSTPLSPFHQAIRDEKAVNDYLKNILAKIDQGQLGEKDLEGLSQEAVDNLNKFLFPSKDDVQPGEHVRWVDERLLNDTRSVRPRTAAKLFQVVNEPLRDLLIYVRPAYIINFVNNIFDAGIEQGIFSAPNFVRALRADSWYGPKVTRMLDAMAGEGRMQSYAPDVGATTRISRKLGAGWNHVTDLHWRRAAVIYEIRKLGYRSTEDIKSAVLRSLEDKTLMKDMTEASRRAKDAMVPFDNMTWAEKAYLRHFIFVYPWQSRSFVWSLKFLRDHPGQAAIFNEIGQSQEAEQDPIFKHLPGFMKDNSVFPVGWQGDNPIVVNPASVDTWGTLGQVVGLFRGDQTISDLFGPGADLLLREVTGRDRFGRQYKNRWTGPITDTLTGLPQVAVYNRANRTDLQVPPNDITNLRGLVAQEHVEAKNSLYVPSGFVNTYGPIMFGGLTSRVLDRKAVEAKFWKNEPYPARTKHEVALMLRESQLQAELINKSVPSDVRDGIRLIGDRSIAYHDFTSKQGRTPTLKEKTELDIQILQDQNLISTEKADELRKRLADAPADQVDNFRSGVIGKLAHGDALAEWHQKVLTVAHVANRATFDGDIQKLVKSKLLPTRYQNIANADDPTLAKYGRGFLDYTEHVKQFIKKAAELSKNGLDTSEVAAELRAYVDEHSEPVKLSGYSLPPYPSLALARLTPRELASARAAIYSTPWLQLSATDKQLAGKTSDPKVSRALVAYAHYTSKEHLDKVLPVGERSLVAFQRLAIIKQLDKAYKLNGSLLSEYKFALLPRFKQYENLAIVNDSPHKKDWKDLLSRANSLWDAARPTATQTAAISQSEMHDAWDQWVKQTLLIIEHKQPAFYAELRPYLAHNPHFLQELVSTSHA